MSSTTEVETLAADSAGEELAQAHNLIANLQTALNTNRRIGIAVGILMAELKIGDHAAFELIRTASQHHNRKVRDIAEEVILTGTLP